MCYTCAFVLMWCLFVDNSRQTTSSVPWHRASKYDLKLIYISMKWFLFKFHFNLCMRRKKWVCLCILRNIQSGFTRGSWWNIDSPTNRAGIVYFFLFLSYWPFDLHFSPSSILWRVCLELNRRHVYCTFVWFQTAASTRWLKLSFCGALILVSLNQTGTASTFKKNVVVFFCFFSVGLILPINTCCHF